MRGIRAVGHGRLEGYTVGSSQLESAATNEKARRSDAIKSDYANRAP